MIKYQNTALIGADWSLKQGEKTLNISRSFVIAVAALSVVGTPVLAAQTGKPSGSISISETQFGFLLGGNVGGGTLTYKGKKYPFKIGGISVGKIGVSKVRGYGHVYNLTDISKFAGKYVGADASATAGKGKGSIRLQNGDVILELDTRSKGLELSASGGGVKITM